jgi:hypothetical protein
VIVGARDRPGREQNFRVAHGPHTMRLGAEVGALTMCAMAAAPREMAHAASPASVGSGLGEHTT